jgi:hypothetical protein
MKKEEKTKRKIKKDYRMIFNTEGLLQIIHEYSAKNDISTRKFIEDACIEKLKKINAI